MNGENDWTENKKWQPGTKELKINKLFNNSSPKRKVFAEK